MASSITWRGLFTNCPLTIPSVRRHCNNTILLNTMQMSCNMVFEDENDFVTSLTLTERRALLQCVSSIHGCRTAAIQNICQQESPDVAKKDALQPTGLQFLLQYYPWRSSKVDDFHFIWKSVLVIDSRLTLALSLTISEIWPFLRTFFLSSSFNRKNLKMFLLHCSLHPRNFVRRESRHRANCSCKKFSTTT